MDNLKNKIKKKKLQIGIIGLGYVGLPLALNFVNKGLNVIGFDIDKNKTKKINSGINYVNASPISKKFTATDNFKKIQICDVVIICVPTPLKKNQLPDISYLIQTVRTIKPYLKCGQLICLESTSYPGTTEEQIVSKIKNRFTVGKNIFVCFSPEREDPGNKKFKNKNVPKVISGHTNNCLKLGKMFYSLAFTTLVPVSSTRTAEFTKLLENIYRSVNIGLVNEMKIISKLMNVNIHEAIKAASTKPFGFKAFIPGPGMGGHCIPIDPFYMSWKAKTLGYNSKFINQAGKINTFMPKWTVLQIVKNLKKKKINLKKCRVLIIGVAYKKNIKDDRESPAYEIINLLKKQNIKALYHDPFILNIKNTRKFKNLNKYKSIKLNEKNLKNFDATIIVTDHDKVNYSKIKRYSKLIFDCRGKFNFKDERNYQNIISI